VGTTMTKLNQPPKEVSELLGQGSVIPIITDPVYPGQHLNISIEFAVPIPKNGIEERYKVYYMLGTPGGLIHFSGGAIWFDIIAVDPT
jgi:hypothetical protein